MIKNYIIITLRNIIKYKGYSLINILGLATGVAVCLLIFLFVQNELSYDKYNVKHDRIYRLYLDAKIADTESALIATSSAPLAAELKQEIPEVEEVFRMRNYGFPVLRYKDKVFSEERIFWADSTIFEVLTFNFVKGNPNTALNTLNGLVITESAAKKYFGDEDPMGKLINVDKRVDYIVTGVMRDIPENSHFHADFIASLSFYADSRSPNWFGNNFYSYILLKENSDPEEVQQKIDAVISKYIKPLAERLFETSWEELQKKGSRYRYVIQPITDIHLKSHINNEIEPNGDIKYVYIFSLIAFGILLIACFNFMNLSTARYSGRAKEVGIRKTLGSSFGQLVQQFLSESIILSFFAVLLSIVIAALTLPIFNEVSGKDISLNFIENPIMIPVLLSLVLIVGILSGIYPAFFLASFKPISVLSGKMKEKISGKTFRGVLVVAQFTISIILVIATIFIFKQLDYLQNKKLGYNKEQLLIVRKADDIGVHREAFKTSLMDLSEVKYVSNITTLPGEEFGDNLFYSLENGQKNSQLVSIVRSDYDFAKTFGIEMADGRYFSREFGADTINSIVLNETAVKSLGIKNPVGKRISIPGNGAEQYFIIIGVTKDFHFQSLHEPIRPLAMMLFGRNGFGRTTAIRIAGGNISSTVNKIKQIWSNFADGQHFEYTFFDEDYAKLYKSEERTGKLFASFSVLGIFIGCLGLFGLAAFTAEKRTKEIGIRKVLGASFRSILILLSKEFLKYLLIANALAIPISYYLISIWLENYSYRISIDIYPFLFSGFAAIVIALGTVLYQVIKIGITNPVVSLKYE